MLMRRRWGPRGTGAVMLIPQGAAEPALPRLGGHVVAALLLASFWPCVALGEAALPPAPGPAAAPSPASGAAVPSSGASPSQAAPGSGAALTLPGAVSMA